MEVLMKKKIGYFIALCMLMVSLATPVMAKSVGWYCYFDNVLLDCYGMQNTCYCTFMDPWDPDF
jgi:uncharacterized membrane protein YbjE (DUF340 family)